VTSIEPTRSADAAVHWDGVYATRPSTSVSWYQRDPSISVRLIRSLTTPASSVVDVGAGASTLVDYLVAAEYDDVTLVDVSRAALEQVERRVGPGAGVSYVAADVLEWEPSRRFDLWHDRALFHFLVDPRDQGSYVDLALSATAPGGHLVLGGFDEDGPTHCSGLAVARHSAADLAATFAPAFDIVSSEREVHHTPSGTVQSFTWVVLRRA
jgi:trans-aconitate methyltransferase